MTNTVSTTVLPEIDFEVGARLADEIILGAAKANKVSTVKGGTVSRESRAWSLGGMVD